MNGGGDSARDGREDVRVITTGMLVDGRYRIVERIGAGGMGSVYRVEHQRLGSSFALKLLRRELAEDERMLQRFERESRAAARLASEHVVPIVDSGTLPDGTPYFVMQLLAGKDLRALLRDQGRLTPVRAANLAIDACRGLGAAHAAGLVHRDLKPANLFVTRGDDGRDVVKLLDFGVVKHTDEVTTQPGALVGTARYMAPEQIGADYRVGPHTDLFALGVILYECIAGAPPFVGDTTERVLYAIMTATPEALDARCEGLPPGLSELVGRALEKHPDARFASAAEFADALLPFAGPRGSLVSLSGSAARIPELPADATSADGTLRSEQRALTPRAAKRSDSRRAWWIAPAAVGALVSSGLGFVLGRSQRSENAAPPSAAPEGRTRELAGSTNASTSPASSLAHEPSASVTPRAAPALVTSNSMPPPPASGVSQREGARARAPRALPVASASAIAPPRPPPTALDPRNPYAE
jgi:serine/threonine-protein kinase